LNKFTEVGLEFNALRVRESKLFTGSFRKPPISLLVNIEGPPTGFYKPLSQVSLVSGNVVMEKLATTARLKNIYLPLSVNE